MSVVQWSDEYLTGDPAVDTQHRILFKMVNALHDAIVSGHAKEAMTEILDTLERYVVKHFAAERHLMEVTGYPDMAAHIRQHNELAATAHDIIQQHRNGELVLGFTVSQFLGRWLTEHIHGGDKKLIAWIKAHRAGAQALHFD